MLTDDQLLGNVAKLLKVDGALIKSELQIYKAQGIAKLFARTKPFWIKSRAELPIALNAYLIEPKVSLPDFWQLRNIKAGATTKRMRIMSEGRFLSQYSDDTVVGTPEICIPLDKELFQLYPRADPAVTLYLSYYYSPKQETITSVGDEWQHVIQDYILAMMWPETSRRVDMLRFFYSGLDDIAAMAKPITEDDIDIESNPLSATIGQEVSKER